ncbi:MAG: Trk family potassium uptake protein [Ruminococcaceae bacterium]|nr:Trk family potassium uptake protein [Oscillospiraceae bacterium]
MKKRRLSHIRFIALGFLIIVAAGTLLLMLPFSTCDGKGASFVSALFTAVSSSCVTGLVLHDTATYWTVFGQIVIISLIQLGGLGFMTVSLFAVQLFHKQTGLRERALLAESINTENLGGMRRLVRIIITGTIIFELSGALLFSIRFIPKFGFAKGIYFSIFHSISAFCNAGFDLMGGYSGEYSSFTAFSDDILVNTTIMLLIIIGGIGFLVWEDILKHRFHFKLYRLHTKIVLLTTVILIFGGALILWLFEINGINKDMPLKEQILTSLFGSVTARTAGFNTTDTALLSDSSKLFTSLLMFIGGSSGSTAGGVKTTTVAVILIYLASFVRGKEPNCFSRKLNDSALKKAVTVIAINLIFALVGTFVISSTNGIAVTDSLFEAFSAMGTVGMTTGITRDLNTLSVLLLAFLMYCGRVGSISFALALFEKRSVPPVSYPTENITIG